MYRACWFWTGLRNCFCSPVCTCGREKGLHPKQKIGPLTEGMRRRIFDAVQGTLHKMTVQGGRDTEKDFFGMQGGYRTMLSKKTVGKPCPYCGNMIQKANYMGGTVYFCPSCQKI